MGVIFHNLANGVLDAEFMVCCSARRHDFECHILLLRLKILSQPYCRKAAVAEFVYDTVSLRDNLPDAYGVVLMRVVQVAIFTGVLYFCAI